MPTKRIAGALCSYRASWRVGQKRGEEECLQGREFLNHRLLDEGMRTVLGKAADVEKE